MMVFAAKNKQHLDQWVSMLTREHQSLASAPHFIPQEDSAPESEAAEEEGLEERVSKRDLAIMYFEEYDISTHVV
jgi:hypothetical protein